MDDETEIEDDNRESEEIDQDIPLPLEDFTRPSLADEGIYETVEREKDEPIKDISGVITEQHLKYISHELGLIALCWEDVQSVDYENRVHYPESYVKNSEKEKILLWHAENFRRQYSVKYPTRRPLLLACDNECGIQKMVCTTIRPTTVRYPEFQTWQGCATFVADHLKYEFLQNPIVLPDRINSPQEVLRRQSGHCFEYSTLLTSFLIAAAYDAYVVSGYATREITLNDQTRVNCPFLVEEVEEEQTEKKQTRTKYLLKEPNDLRSKFLLEMEAREVQKEKDAIRAQELAELAAMKEYEKPWPDSLWGWRLHSWVLVLPSKDVIEPFFIECVSGNAKSVSDPEYHGIESVWNHLNYWVLVQFPGKTETCQDIIFELNDVNYWEHLLVGEPFTNRLLPPEMMDAEKEEVEEGWVDSEKHLDMPSSWVNKLELPLVEHESRFPSSKKITNYRKCVAEQFAPYVHADGLILRVTNFLDYDFGEIKEVKESYSHRVDYMYFSHKNLDDSSVVQKFRRGRDDALKEHRYYTMDVGIETKFQMKFYHEARLDGLSTLTMDPKFMIEEFEKRTDFLYHRAVDFAPRDSDAPFRDINKITEKYLRNPEVEAAMDVATVEYLFPKRKIQVSFHYEYQHVTQTYREFQKPPATEMGERLAYDPSLTSGYLTGPKVPRPKPLYLFQLESMFFRREEASVRKVRDRENELIVLLRQRGQEMVMPHLVVSEFDVERNVEAKEGFKERERKIEETNKRSLELGCDFLSPYYAKLGESPEKPLPMKEAQKMMEDCLQDWKNLLVARANEIQQQFEQASQDLQDKNNWYERNQGSLTKEQEEDYFDYCKRNIFLLHTLEARLNRHRDLAPQKYLAIEAYLRSDPRMAVLFRKPKRRRHV